MQLRTLSRSNLADEAEAALRERIVLGELAAGARLNEVHLAAQLGVSRTPLREALNRLAAEGALETRPGHGYFVRPLSFEEFDGLYDMRPILDPEALRLAGLPSKQQIEALERLNERLARTKDPLSRISRDDEWHMTLIAGCPNRVLTELITNMMLRTRRYELAYMREAANISMALNGHDKILAKLKSGQLSQACEALRQNLVSGKPAIAAWLASRTRSEKK